MSTVKQVIRNDIQALRAFAVLAVVLCHMNPAWLPGGFLGVDIFFVISGFVITKLLLGKDKKISIANFWLQRLFRILPAYFVMLIVVVTLAAVIFLPENFSQFVKSWQKSLLFISNKYFASYGDYFSPALTEQPLLHTWSLAVEMQFYLLYPLFILILLKVRMPSILLFVMLVGFVFAQWIWTQSNSTIALYYDLFIRAPEFLMGCSLAMYVEKINSMWLEKNGIWLALIGYFLMLISLILVNEKNFSPLIALIVSMGVALVILGNVKQGLLSTIYNNKVILLIGVLSYSIYLWHWPILSFIRYLYGDIRWTLISIGCYITLVLFLGWLSWSFIEKKFKLNALNINNIKFFFVIFIFAVLPFTYAQKVNAIVPSLPIEFTRYADHQTICHGKILNNCVRGNSLNNQILLIGDSHAAQLNLATDIAGEALEIGFEVISASSCVPLADFDVKKLPEWAQKACLKQIEVVSQKLKTAKQVILAGMWSYQFQDPTFPGVLISFIETAQNNGQQVGFLAQIPKLTKNPRRLSRLHYFGVNLQAQLDKDWASANSSLIEILNNYPKIKIFEPSHSELLAKPPLYEQKLIYHDEHHLNEIGAAYYGRLLADWIKISFTNNEKHE